MAIQYDAKKIKYPTIRMRSLFILIISFTPFFLQAQINGEYRTKSSGDWSDPAIWERFDGANWNVATASPLKLPALTITIREGHSVRQNLLVEANGTLINIESGGLLHIASQIFLFSAQIHNRGSVIQSSRLYSFRVSIYNYKRWRFEDGSSVFADSYFYFYNTDSLSFVGKTSIGVDRPADYRIFNSRHIGIERIRLGDTTRLCYIDNAAAGTVEVNNLSSVYFGGIVNNGRVSITGSTIDRTGSIVNNGQFELDGSMIKGVANFTGERFDHYGTLSMKASRLICGGFWDQGETTFEGTNEFSVGVFDATKSRVFPLGTKVVLGGLNTRGNLFTFVFNDSSWCSGPGKAIVNSSSVLTGLMSDTTINYGQVINNGGMSRYMENHGKMLLAWNLAWNLGAGGPCTHVLNNYGEILLDKFGKLYDGTSAYWMPCTIKNFGRIKGQGVIMNDCTSVSGGFSPLGRISLNIPMDTFDLDVRMYMSGNAPLNDTIESWAPIKLGKKLRVHELAPVPNGKYLIISSLSHSVSGNFDSVDLPAGYSVAYEESKVYLIKNLAIITYAFSGSGLWSNPANWSGGSLPPNPLPANSVIVINGSGECVLDVPQTLSNGASLRVEPGKVFKVNGNLIRQ